MGGGHHGRGFPVEADEKVRAPEGVVAHEPADLTCTVRGGTSLAELDEALGRAGQELPVLGLPATATVGGVLSSGASTRRRLKVGSLRDRVLQVKVVTGDGRVVKGGGPTVKNVSGYDLCRLACGSLGTLGLIEEVILKVTPVPERQGWWVATMGSGAEAMATALAVLDLLYDPAAVEVSGPPWAVRVLLEGQAADVAAQAERLPTGFAESGEPPLLPDEAVEVAVPPAALPSVVDGDIPVRAQLGVGLVYMPPEGARVRERAEALGGRLHTLRPLPGVDPFGVPPPGLSIMRRLKDAFDPDGVLNPGRMGWF